MLTTFDISPGSSEEASPTTPYNALSFPEIPTLDTEAIGFDTEDFFDDDFGLSEAAMRQKAEMLRLQQLKVEEEIARLQQQDQIVRKIPDKPPPPYVPPITYFIPSSADKVANIIEKTVTDLFNAKHGNFDPSSLTFDKTLTEGGKNLSEAELML